ncbi:MAG: hypothetical protein JWQ03_3178, partial [Variovorax sp.]|nr:hypothetical protein [Variovorax sp.]
MSIDAESYLLKFPKELLQTEEGRRQVTKYDPIAWSLIYFRDSLRDEYTGNAITLSQFHIDIAQSAIKWAKPSLGPMELREAWVAPRGTGKSTWMFLILPAWALAHGHRKLIVAFADNADLATNHLATFKRKIQTENELIIKDYPDLAVGKRRPNGMTDSDKQGLYLAKSGAGFMAKGIESTSLGTKVGDQRPDLILFDDVEPPATTYSLNQKDGRLALIRDAILPMNINAVVEFVGTVTMDGSIMHDIVRNAMEGGDTAPDWVVGENIVTHYYPALLDGSDGNEQSLWPQRWSTEFLQTMRESSPRSFALNYMNQPVPLNSPYWSQEMFKYGELVAPTKHIISVDPAVTTNRKSDFTGIAVFSYSDLERKAILRHAEAVKLSPDALRLHLIRLVERFGSRMMLIETNQGGDTWKSVFHDFPLPIVTVHQTEKKELRWAQTLDYWPQGFV